MNPYVLRAALDSRVLVWGGCGEGLAVCGQLDWCQGDNSRSRRAFLLEVLEHHDGGGFEGHEREAQLRVPGTGRDAREGRHRRAISRLLHAARAWRAVCSAWLHTGTTHNNVIHGVIWYERVPYRFRTRGPTL